MSESTRDECPSRDEHPFKAGYVYMATWHLLESKEHMMAMMGHHTRPHVYGAVNFDRDLPHDMYSVTWSIYGLFNMDDAEVSEINSESKYIRYLNLVRKYDDANEGGDAYLKQFFEHDGSKWKLQKIAIACEICNQDEWFYCSRSRTETRCRRSHAMTQIPMLQLYFDLELEINAHMTMAQKRFTCYKFYTKVVHVVLTVGDRRRVCQCVDEEIGRKFPRQEGVGRVGFRLG